MKPRDNSGSRGVIYCADRTAAVKAVSEAFEYKHKNSVLVEEFVGGQEYSIESLHYKGQTYVIQFTQKITTKFLYNVELGYIQPAELSDEQKKNEIRRVVSLIADALNFDICTSHTELKINEHGIIVIETSLRLGGDFITSRFTPLSTGVNLEQLLIRMSLGEEIDSGEFEVKEHKSSGVVFFELPEGRIESIGDIYELCSISGFQEYVFEKNVGDEVQRITNSLNRYGHIIFQTEDTTDTTKSMEDAKNIICEIVRVE